MANSSISSSKPRLGPEQKREKPDLKRLIAEIKDKVTIESVIGEHVVLRKGGANLSGLCPFHQERTPSFSVSPAKQLFHCYGCKKGGDLIHFVMEMHALSFVDAVRELAERAGIKATELVGRGGEVSDQARAAKELGHKLNRFAAGFYHQNLSAKTPLGEQARSYLASRFVTKEELEAFYVGLAPEGWDALSTFLIEKKAPMPLAEQLGLIRPSKNMTQGVGFFDLFRSRILFPILDIRGKVAGFGGRTLLPNEDKSTPKYLNSNESILFQKSKLLFGLFQAQKHIRELDQVILVEGYFDVLAMHRHGFAQAVATCGTSLSEDHLKTLSRFASKIIVIFDGDEAGERGALKAMEAGLKMGAVLYGVTIPEGLDPDEFLERPDGKEKLTALLAQATPILDQKIEQCIGRSAKDNEAKVQAIKDIGGWLRSFSDPVGRDLRVAQVCKSLEITPQLLMGGEFRRTAQAVPAATRPVKVRPQVNPSKSEFEFSPSERVLLAGLVNVTQPNLIQDLYREAKELIPSKLTLSDLFDYTFARAFVAQNLDTPDQALHTLKTANEAPDLLLGQVEDTQVRSILTEALMGQGPVGVQNDEDRTQAVKQALRKRAFKVWARFSHALKQALADAEAKKDAELRQKLMQEYLDVQRRMKEFNSFYDEA